MELSTAAIPATVMISTFRTISGTSYVLYSSLNSNKIVAALPTTAEIPANIIIHFNILLLSRFISDPLEHLTASTPSSSDAVRISCCNASVSSTPVSPYPLWEAKLTKASCASVGY
eukprot:NODE_734_length_4350_cov_0.639849.p5 type:complete len:116 gc:universal NODE_734_length_4350_cov_0.639849:2064-1717(-)